MYEYSDSNKKVIIISSIIIFTAVTAIGLDSFLKGDITLAIVVWGIDLFMVGFLLRLLYSFRFDFTGYTKYWITRNKCLHIPINQINSVEYCKRVYGGWSRKARLIIHYKDTTELVLLIKPRTEHYELLRLLHGCGVEIDVKILYGHYDRPATEEELKNLFNYD